MNMPIELCDEQFFANWTQNATKLEKNTDIIKDKYMLDSFKKRRRHWIFIIPCHSSELLHSVQMRFGDFFNPEKVNDLLKLEKDDPKLWADLISIRNALLLYKVLKKERIREMDICIDAFDVFEVKYKHFCLNHERANIIAKP